MNKVYVCFISAVYEGCSEPKAVFSDEQKAKDWVKNNFSYCSDPEYVELEVQ